jgi:hypothetical protein
MRTMQDKYQQGKIACVVSNDNIAAILTFQSSCLKCCTAAGAKIPTSLVATFNPLDASVF